MNKVPIILCFDERILLGAGVTIRSLIQSAHHSTAYQILILQPGFDDATKSCLTSLVHNTHHEISFFHVPKSRFSHVPTNRGSWTEIVYYRLIASEILPEFDKAIYSDVDVFICRDLHDLYATDMTGYEWGGVAAQKNFEGSTAHKYFPENTNNLIYFSGFMLMNLKLMRENRSVDRYFDIVRSFSDRLKFFDLDILNLSTDKIKRLPFDYVLLEDIYETENITLSKDYSYLQTVYDIEELEQARDNPAIIHYAGERGKPWQRQDMPQYYCDHVDALPACLKVFNFRTFRKKWFSRKSYRKRSYRSAMVQNIRR